MICVSIGRTRHKMVVAEHHALAERGAQLVELRLDWLAAPPDLGKLISNRPTPVVVTCRREIDKGKWKFGEDQRRTLLRTAIVAGAEYVDIEDDIAHEIPRYGMSQRIVSHHNFEETPEEIEAIHEKMTKLDPDIIKIVTMANSPSDSVRMLKLVADSKVPTIGFCMGELGTFSRILTGRYGAPFTYATFNKDRELAPGQLSFDEMVRIYRYDRIDRSTELFGVIGDPIGHSLSPLIHNMAYHELGMNRVYLPFRIPRDQLAQTLRDLYWLEMKGYSVTIPHKEKVVEMVQHYDGPIPQIGAANTLYRDKSDNWWASNTDYEAALSSLRNTLTEGKTTPGIDVLAGKRVLMLGAGGVARAIGMGLVQSGAALTISNRTASRAVALAQHLSCQHASWENRGSVHCDILINCTAMGMHPNVDETPFPENWMQDGMLVFDTVYNPEQTLLLKHAKERNCKIVSGVEMFVRQAALQFEKFTQTAAPMDTMREALRRSISPVRH